MALALIQLATLIHLDKEKKEKKSVAHSSDPRTNRTLLFHFKF